MEAPEIIWLSPNEYRSNEPSCFWSESQRTDYDIEYICKDAFIEKACEGIEHLLSGYIIRNFNFGDSYKIDTLIEDFKKYIKSE